jgi:hypothetical protein
MIQWRYKRLSGEWTSFMNMEDYESMERTRNAISNLMGRIWPILGWGVQYEFREIT